MDYIEAFKQTLESLSPRGLRWLSGMLRDDFSLIPLDERRDLYSLQAARLTNRIYSIANNHPQRKFLILSINEIIKLHFVADDALTWIESNNIRLLGFIFFETLTSLPKIKLEREQQIQCQYKIILSPEDFKENPQFFFLPPITLKTRQLDLRSFSITPSIRWHEIFIEAFDDWTETIDKKTHFLSHLKSKWGNIENRNPLTNWLDKSNPEQVAWTWAYIKDRLAKEPMKNPNNIWESYNFSLIALDNHSFEHEAVKSVFIDRMKKSWSQQKFRASGRTKAPYYLPLSSSTRKKLDKLSKEKGKSISDIISEVTDYYLTNSKK